MAISVEFSEFTLYAAGILSFNKENLLLHGLGTIIIIGNHFIELLSHKLTREEYEKEKAERSTHYVNGNY